MASDTKVNSQGVSPLLQEVIQAGKVGIRNIFNIYSRRQESIRDRGYIFISLRKGQSIHPTTYIYIFIPKESVSVKGGVVSHRELFDGYIFLQKYARKHSITGGSASWQLLVKSVSLQFLYGPLQEPTHTHPHTWRANATTDVFLRLTSPRKQRYESTHQSARLLYCSSIQCPSSWGVVLQESTELSASRHTRMTTHGVGRGSQRMTPLDLIFRIHEFLLAVLLFHQLQILFAFPLKLPNYLSLIRTRYSFG